jgi:hypothetical protein
MKIYEFDAQIIKHDSIDAAFIEFPYDVEKEFGVKGQVKVNATFDGYEYRGSLAKMGHHCHCLGITQNIRKAINKQPGDTVHIVLKKDDEERTIDIPEDFKELLEANNSAKNFFQDLSYTNKRKFVEWISSSKKVETRERRLRDSIEMLLNSQKL